MQAITNPKTSFLLEAGLDILHFESKEWFSELDLLDNELRFFTKLLKSKVFKLEKEKQWQHILENIDKLFVAVTQEMKQEVKAHEKELASMLLGKSNESDEQFRARHKLLQKKMTQLKNDALTQKMLLFRFLEGKM
jgi:hypothetical protein